MRTGRNITFATSLQTQEVEVDFDIDHSVSDGNEIRFDLTLDGMDGQAAQLSVVKYLEPLSIAIQPDEWHSDAWGTWQDTAAKGTTWITDSPQGNQVNDFTTVTCAHSLDLSKVSWAHASFDAKWSIETFYDFVQLQGSTDGQAWIPLCGKYTKPGAPGSPLDIPSPYARQPEGEPVYDGHQLLPVREEVDLGSLIGAQDVRLRFVGWSGAFASAITEDGFYFNDFTIYTSRPDYCSDHVQDADETGVDCGGAFCNTCPTCSDGIQNGDEAGIDCGGASCVPCATCSDGIQNGNETGIDCGGGSCAPCATCSDGIMNGDEEGVDCGGACAPCPTCIDHLQNGDETGVDCGGSVCAPCKATCDDGMMNGDEEGIDCGGSCMPCRTTCCEDSPWRSLRRDVYNIRLSPNPAGSTITFELRYPDAETANTESDLHYEITDLTGRHYLNGTFGDITEIDISSLPQQMYVLRVCGSSGYVAVGRFLKTQTF